MTATETKAARRAAKAAERRRRRWGPSGRPFSPRLRRAGRCALPCLLNDQRGGSWAKNTQDHACLLPVGHPGACDFGPRCGAPPPELRDPGRALERPAPVGVAP